MNGNVFLSLIAFTSIPIPKIGGEVRKELESVFQNKNNDFLINYKGEIDGVGKYKFSKDGSFFGTESFIRFL